MCSVFGSVSIYSYMICSKIYDLPLPPANIEVKLLRATNVLLQLPIHHAATANETKKTKEAKKAREAKKAKEADETK